MSGKGPTCAEILDAIDYMGRNSWLSFVPTWTLAGLLADRPTDIHRRVAVLCAYMWRHGVIERVMLPADTSTAGRPAWRRASIGGSP